LLNTVTKHARDRWGGGEGVVWAIGEKDGITTARGESLQRAGLVAQGEKKRSPRKRGSGRAVGFGDIKKGGKMGGERIKFDTNHPSANGGKRSRK